MFYMCNRRELSPGRVLNLQPYAESHSAKSRAQSEKTEELYALCPRWGRSQP